MTQLWLLSRALGFAATATVLASSLVVSAQEQKGRPRKSPFTAAVEKVKPALVVLQEPGEKGAHESRRRSHALGITIDCKGTIVTNHSLIKSWKKIEITLSNGRRLPSKAVFSDPDLDLAVIRVEDAKALPHAEFGDSEKLQLGDYVLVLSSPWSDAVIDSLTVTAGIIGGRVRAAKKGEWLLVDTAVGPGSGPGPLISPEGKFVGLVVSRKLGPHGMTVPSSRAKDRVVEWLKGE
jgi:serine protease Do